MRFNRSKSIAILLSPQPLVAVLIQEGQGSSKNRFIRTNVLGLTFGKAVNVYRELAAAASSFWRVQHLSTRRRASTSTCTANLYRLSLDSY
jgi:hypothetical protein